VSGGKKEAASGDEEKGKVVRDAQNVPQIGKRTARSRSVCRFL